jgi:phage/plasmid-like protein (TIGR03299 family)
MSSATDKLAELDRRASALTSGATRQDTDGRIVSTQGWDKGEVLGQDGLARQENGEVSLVSGRGIVPWHQLGTVVDQALSVGEGLRLSGNDFEAVKVPLFFGAVEDSVMGSDLEPSSVGLVRSDNRQHLGVVGKKFEVIQPRQAFSFLDELVQGEGDTKLDTVGMLANGTMFMALELPDNIVLDAEGMNDKLAYYLTSLNRFDGTAAFRINASPFRPVCGNTVRWGTEHAASSWSVHHRKNWARRMDEARRTLKLSAKYREAFTEEATALIQHDMTPAEFDAFVASVMPIDEDAKALARKRTEERRDQVRNLYENSSTQENIRGTAWAAEQAYVEWLDHMSGVRAPKTLTEDLVRAAKTLVGANDEKKTSAHKQLLTLTNR